jgi:hypothetical protein
VIYENTIFEDLWILSIMAVTVLAGVGIYLGSQSRSHVIVTDRLQFWLRLIGGIILAYSMLGFFFFYTSR